MTTHSWTSHIHAKMNTFLILKPSPEKPFILVGINLEDLLDTKSCDLGHLITFSSDSNNGNFTSCDLSNKWTLRDHLREPYN